MRIAIFDECGGKFTSELKAHWESIGHEIKYDKYFNPLLVEWCDVALFDWAGNNIQRASHEEDSLWKECGVVQPKNKKIIVREHDLDIFVGQHRGINYSWVNHLIFVSKHMQERALSDISLPENTKVHLIPHGVNPDKFTFRKKQNTKKIAWIGNICDHKRMELALMILAELPREYSLHVVGGGLGSWRKAYADYYIKQNNLNVTFTDRVDNVNDFLEDKDFLLHTGEKEAFLFVAAEAALKGIKPLIHNFFGANEVWKDFPTVWNTVSEVKQMILEDKYEPEVYRDYVLKNFSYQDFINKYDEIINY